MKHHVTSNMAKGVIVMQEVEVPKLMAQQNNGIASLSLLEQEFLIIHLPLMVISVVHMPLDGSKEATLKALAK